MNLEKAKGILEDLIYDYVFEKRVATTEEIKAMEKVLIEIDRLKEISAKAFENGFKQAKFDCEMDKLNEPKEITLRDGLELIQKQCDKAKIGECNQCPMNCITCYNRNFDTPYMWDIDNIIQAVEKLKEENE